MEASDVAAKAAAASAAAATTATAAATTFSDRVRAFGVDYVAALKSPPKVKVDFGVEIQAPRPTAAGAAAAATVAIGFWAGKRALLRRLDKWADRQEARRARRAAEAASEEEEYAEPEVITN